MHCSAREEDSGFRIRRSAPGTIHIERETWLESLQCKKLHHVACSIISELAEGFDIRWSEEAPAELADKPTAMAGTSFAFCRTEGSVREAEL